MRKIILILSVIASCYLVQKSFVNWDEQKGLEIQNLKLQNNNSQIHDAIKELEGFDDQPLKELQEGYKRINNKISLFARSLDIKTAIDFIKSNKRGFFSELEEDSQWIGVKQMTLDIKFYEIKSLEEYMNIVGFLDTLEASNYLKVINIYQAGESLQTRVQIYGRGI